MTGTTVTGSGSPTRAVTAAMEPRADDGDDWPTKSLVTWISTPQWSPVLMTGTTGSVWAKEHGLKGPQWSPVLMTGTTWW